MDSIPRYDRTLEQRMVIGVGDFAASNNPHLVLSTFALGSCIGLLAYDPVRSIGGLLHNVLPDSTLNKENAKQRPAMYADTGFALLMRTMMGLGARVSTLRFIIAGGAGRGGHEDFFRIGERNLKAVDHLLKRYNLEVRHRFVGGSINRTIHFSVGTGVFTLKTHAATETFTCYSPRSN